MMFLLAFVVFMQYYQRRRLAESMRALDRACMDHYEITPHDRELQRASVKQPTI